MYKSLPGHAKIIPMHKLSQINLNKLLNCELNANAIVCFASTASTRRHKWKNEQAMSWQSFFSMAVSKNICRQNKPYSAYRSFSPFSFIILHIHIYNKNKILFSFCHLRFTLRFTCTLRVVHICKFALCALIQPLIRQALCTLFSFFLVYIYSILYEYDSICNFSLHSFAVFFFASEFASVIETEKRRDYATKYILFILHQLYSAALLLTQSFLLFFE